MEEKFLNILDIFIVFSKWPMKIYYLESME